MKQRFVVPGLVLLGICLLGLGLGWDRIRPTTAYWTPEQAEEYSTSQSDLHAQWHTHTDNQDHEQEAVAAKERFLKSLEALESARNSRTRTGNLLVMAGTGVLLLGIAIHLAAGRRE